MFFKPKNIFIVFAVLLGLVFSYGKVLGDDLSTEKYNELKIKLDSLTQEMNTCNGLSEKAKIDCITAVYNKMTGVKAELDKYAKEIGAKAEELQKDIKSLSNQIGYLDAKVEKTEVEIRITQQEIDLINLDISKIEEEIKITEEEIKNTENKIEETRQRLADTIKKIYEYDTQNLVKITLTSGTLSDFFDEISYIENLQKSLSANLDQLKEEKKNLEEKKSGLEDQKASLAEKRREVSEKIDSFNKTIAELDAEKREKAILLESTKGNEEEYQKLLAAIEQQKKQLLGNLSILSQSRQAEIEEIVKRTGGRIDPIVFGNYTYFAQDSGPWAQTCINGICGTKNDPYTMARYGCFITSMTMLLRFYGVSVTPADLASNSKILTEGDIGFIATKAASEYGLTCYDGCTSAKWGNFNASVVDNYLINKQKPVIIGIKASGGGTHFVLAIGKIGNNYYVLDPIYSVSQGKAVSIEASVENIKDIYGGSATISRMVIIDY